MKRLLFVLILLAVVLLTVPGCGFIVSKLPRVKLEPPPSPAQPAQTEAVPAPEPAEPAAELSGEQPKVIQGTLPKPAGGSSGSGSSVKYVPVGAQRTLTTSDLSGLSKWQLDVLRNEIYAAHGRTFDRSDLRSYFDRQTWYQPDSGFSEARLSSLEKRNAAAIAEYQKRRGQVSSGSRTTSTRRSGSQASSTGYVLPFSSSRVVTSSDLSGLSRWELDVARNEIYARHGRSFNRSDLRNHFGGQPWYAIAPGFSESDLSSLERRNVEFIRKYR